MGKDGSEIDSACIVTTGANEVLAPIHDRMPVIVGTGDYDRWLDARHAANSVEDLLRPAADDLLDAVAVSPRVNKAVNDDPGLLEPIESTRLL
jgi:putative SOS response-associated peptidase YedK